MRRMCCQRSIPMLSGVLDDSQEQTRLYWLVMRYWEGLEQADEMKAVQADCVQALAYPQPPDVLAGYILLLHLTDCQLDWLQDTAVALGQQNSEGSATHHLES